MHLANIEEESHIQETMKIRRKMKKNCVSTLVVSQLGKASYTITNVAFSNIGSPSKIIKPYEHAAASRTSIIH